MEAAGVTWCQVLATDTRVEWWVTRHTFGAVTFFGAVTAGGHLWPAWDRHRHTDCGLLNQKTLRDSCTGCQATKLMPLRNTRAERACARLARSQAGREYGGMAELFPKKRGFETLIWCLLCHPWSKGWMYGLFLPKSSGSCVAVSLSQEPRRRFLLDHARAYLALH